MSYDIDQELCQLFLKASNGDSESQIRVESIFVEKHVSHRFGFGPR